MKIMAVKIKEAATTFAVNKVIDYLGDEFNQDNLLKALTLVDKYDKKDAVKGQRRVFRQVIEDKNSNWYKLFERVWELDTGVRKTFFKNFINNATILGVTKQEEARQKNNCNIPWAILMDPTSACNLKCTGCWAAEYGDKLSMDYETLNNIIAQGKALGTYMYIYSGGEPLVRKADIIKLCKGHPDCMFLAFTNGTLIDEAFADQMLEVKNFMPAISIEGYESATDSRRGDGVYKKVIRAMKILKARNLGFGASLCYTSANTDVIGSDEFMDELVDLGCLFAWYFTYMPVGTNAATELIATAEQRKFMYEKIREWRNTKSIFTMDFWNDGEYVKGCIAGGRYYCHINANGDIEPCAFIHYSDSNIHDKTLLEAFKSPLFMQYKENQPFNENHLRPCPLLDNKGALENMVEKSGAKSTDLESPEDIHELTKKCEHAADCWETTSAPMWEETLIRRKNLPK